MKSNITREEFSKEVGRSSETSCTGKWVSGVFMLCCVTKQSGSTRSRGPEELVWPSRRFGIGWTRTGTVDSMHSIPSRDAIKGKLARFHKRWPIISAPSRRTTVPFRLPLLSNKLSD